MYNDIHVLKIGATGVTRETPRRTGSMLFRSTEPLRSRISGMVNSKGQCGLGYAKGGVPQA